MSASSLLSARVCWSSRTEHGQHRRALPPVRKLQSLADALVRHLTTLALQRVARHQPTLDSYLATKRATNPAGNVAGHTVAASSAPQETRE